MKALILTLIATIVLAAGGEAKSKDEVKLRIGQEKTVVHGDLRIKFISVLEDSRCPANATCIWAGNAKIELMVADKRGRSKVVEINTNLEPRGERYGGWAINLSGLTGKDSASKYVATLKFERLVK